MKLASHSLRAAARPKLAGDAGERPLLADLPGRLINGTLMMSEPRDPKYLVKKAS